MSNFLVFFGLLVVFLADFRVTLEFFWRIYDIKLIWEGFLLSMGDFNIILKKWILYYFSLKIQSRIE
jgi:hypothetical protein